MNKAKRKSLEDKGWKVGSVKEFLKIRIPRKLKKKYKKMGIWSAYLSVKNYSGSPAFIAIRRQAFEDMLVYGECRVSSADLVKVLL